MRRALCVAAEAPPKRLAPGQHFSNRFWICRTLWWHGESRLDKTQTNATYRLFTAHPSTRAFHVARPVSLRDVARPVRPRHRGLSTAAAAEEDEDEASDSKKSASTAQQWRQMVKPFLLKCHPDVLASQLQKQEQGLTGWKPSSSSSAESRQVLQRVNLQAIQNLHSYLDTVQAVADALLGSGSTKKLPRNPKPIVTIDFILLVEDKKSKIKKHHDTPIVSSRRKVELALPHISSLLTVSRDVPAAARLAQLSKHVKTQLTQLLRVAGLQKGRMGVEFEDDRLPDDDSAGPEQDQQQQQQKQERRRHVITDTPKEEFSKSRYQANRDAYVARINWKKVDQLYDEALRDMEAVKATEGLLANDPERRQSVIAQILARIKVQRWKAAKRSSSNNKQRKQSNTDIESESAETQGGIELPSDGDGGIEEGHNSEEEDEEEVDAADRQAVRAISLVEELQAFRRLSLLLELYFDELELEAWGSAWWDRLQLILTPARPYNTSPTALYKRRQKMVGADTGFSLTMHAAVPTPAPPPTSSALMETSGNDEGQHAAPRATPPPKISMTIPVDFGDEEVVNELQRNLEEFQEWIGDGFDEIFDTDEDDPTARKTAEEAYWSNQRPWDS